MLSFGIIDGILKEPLGGAHSAPEEMAALLKEHIKKEPGKLIKIKADKRIDARINKYSNIGVYDTVPTEATVGEQAMDGDS